MYNDSEQRDLNSDCLFILYVSIVTDFSPTGVSRHKSEQLHANLIFVQYSEKLRGYWVRLMFATILSRTCCLLACCLKTQQLKHTNQ
jgi:hypothetical protein